MNIKTAANLIASEYRSRIARAENAYMEAMRTYPLLYESEKKLRAAIIDNAPNDIIDSLKDNIKTTLLSLGLNPDDYTAKPICPICEDKGFVNGKFCKCAKRRATAESVGSSAPPVTFDDCDFSIFDNDTLPTIKMAYEKMQIFCEKFPETKNTNILILGGVGTGKTYLTACIANEIEQRGFSCLFLSAFRFNHLCLTYHTTFEASRNDVLNALLKTDLLVIDDLGTESILKNVSIEYLYTVINERMLNGLHTIINTNLTPDALEARYGERTVSRLFSKRVCLTIALSGKDLRR